jgi:hypothetical protein
MAVNRELAASLSVISQCGKQKFAAIVTRLAWPSLA